MGPTFRLALFVSFLMQLACSSDGSRPAAVDPRGCWGGVCEDVGKDAARDATLDADAPNDSSGDEGADAYNGPRGTVHGRVFVSNLPDLATEMGEAPPLYHPASVSIWAQGHKYEALFVGDEYVLSAVPTGAWSLVVRDQGGKNGIVQTVVPVEIAEGEVTRNIPATARTALAIVYGLQEPKLLRHPDFSQVLMTFYACQSEGGQRLAGVSVESSSAEAAIVHDGFDWVTSAEGVTSDNGTVILANLPAAAYPGERISLSYTFGEQTYQTPTFTVFKDSVSRVVVVVPC